METYLRRLVAFQTASGEHAENAALLDYVESFLVERGLHSMRFSFNGFDAMVATTRPGSKTPRVLLGAHADVVPGPPAMFTLRKEQGKYLGRGTFDMKFAVAAYIQVVDELAASGALATHDFGVMITTDEEIGGANGVKKLVELGYRPGVCILPDAGPEWQIETLAKGFVSATVATQGRSGHGSQPWLADSATFKLIDLLSEIKKLFRTQDPQQGPEATTLNISILRSGQALTQIPDHADAVLDIRFPRKESYDKIRRHIEALCAAHDATYREDLYGAPCVNRLDDPLIQPFAKIMAEETGVPATGAVSYGATDARYFAEADVPCIIARPPAGGHHGDDEWVSVAGTETFAVIVRRYLERVA